MTWPPGNEILIDTNVFKHLCDKDAKYNPDGHVDALLVALALNKCVLLIDDAGIFLHEFNELVMPQFKRESQIGGELEILRYWADPGNYSEKEIASNKQLIDLIKKVIIEKHERADRAFVYLAFTNGRVLVTNDELHIVFGPPSKKVKGADRRTRMMKAAKKHIVDGAAILLSREAHSCLEVA